MTNGYKKRRAGLLTGIALGAAAVAYGPNIYHGYEDFANARLASTPYAPTSPGLSWYKDAASFASRALLKDLPESLQKDLPEDVNKLSLEAFATKYSDQLSKGTIHITARPAMFDLRDVVPGQGLTEIFTDMAQMQPLLSGLLSMTGSPLITGSNHTYTTFEMGDQFPIVIEALSTAPSGRPTANIVSNVTGVNYTKVYAPASRPFAGMNNVVWGWDSAKQISAGEREHDTALNIAVDYVEALHAAIVINKKNIEFTLDGDAPITSNTVTFALANLRGVRVPSVIREGILLDGSRNSVPGINTRLSVEIDRIDPKTTTLSDLFDNIVRGERDAVRTLPEHPISTPIELLEFVPHN